MSCIQSLVLIFAIVSSTLAHATQKNDTSHLNIGLSHESKSYEKYHIVKFLPFGAGQFYNDSLFLGSTFATVQVAALVYWYQNTVKMERGEREFRDFMQAEPDQYYDENAESYKSDLHAYRESMKAQQRSLIQLFAAAWLASTIEAVWNTPTANVKLSPTFVSDNNGRLAPRVFMSMRL